MTLVIDLVGIIDQYSLIDHGRDGLVDHPSGDSIFEKRFFDGLLAESILIPVSVSGSDVTGDCLIGAFLKNVVLSFGSFSIESFVPSRDLRALDETERDKSFDSSFSSNSSSRR